MCTEILSLIVHICTFIEPVNFASDWGKFLQNDNEQMPNFKKKIAIIFYTHYIGEVEVRVRQLEAMGWSVVLVSDTFFV